MHYYDTAKLRADLRTCQEPEKLIRAIWKCHGGSQDRGIAQRARILGKNLPDLAKGKVDHTTDQSRKEGATRTIMSFALLAHARTHTSTYVEQALCSRIGL